MDPPVKSRFTSFLSQDKPSSSSSKLDKRDAVPLLARRRRDRDDESIERHRRGSFEDDDSVETSSSCWSLWSDSNSYDSISVGASSHHHPNAHRNGDDDNPGNDELAYDSTYVDSVTNPPLKEGSTAQAILGRRARYRYDNRKCAWIIAGAILLGAAMRGTFLCSSLLREEYSKSMFAEALPPRFARAYGTLFGNDGDGNGNGQMVEGEGERDTMMMAGGELNFRELPQGGSTLEIFPDP